MEPLLEAELDAIEAHSHALAAREHATSEVRRTAIVLANAVVSQRDGHDDGTMVDLCLIPYRKALAALEAADDGLTRATADLNAAHRAREASTRGEAKAQR